MPTYVLYHGGCYDGFGAAWSAWRALGDTAEYIPVTYGSPPPLERIDPISTVYVVDFSYPREQMLGLYHHVSGIRVLDHHKTAEKELEGFDFCTFDMNRSGAMLAWNYFHPKDDAPPLIQYVQDRDLWRFVLPHSREITAWLCSYPMHFGDWEQCHEYLCGSLESVALEGAAILRFQSEMVSVMCRQATWRDIGGLRVPVANATVFFSEVGDELCKQNPGAPFAAYYMDRGDGKRQWGLRSRNGFDVSEIATMYGGGGHPAAAGFVEALPR